MTTHKYVQCDYPAGEDGCDETHDVEQRGPAGWAYISLGLAGETAEQKRTLHLCPQHAPEVLKLLSVKVG